MKAFVFVLCSLVSLPVFAGGPEPEPTPTSVVQTELIRPLARNERKSSRFGRKSQPISRRTVRVNDQALSDANGASFHLFRIEENGLRGCVYPERGEVYVKRGDVYYPAAFLLGKTKTKAASHLCNAAEAKS